MVNKKYSLIGIDGNACAVISYVKRAMRECRCSKEQIKAYRAKATSRDYYNLLVASEEQIQELNNRNENYV